MGKKFIDKEKRITTDMCFDKIQTKGRPKLILNQLGKEIVESVAQCHCTEEEIASILDVSIETLKTKANAEAFSECIKRGQEYGKASLRRWQFEKAKKGDSVMLIWLGKQYLGQRDTIDVKADEEQLKKLDDILTGMAKNAYGKADDIDEGGGG